MALLMVLQSFAIHTVKHKGVEQPSSKRQQAGVPAKSKGRHTKVGWVMATKERGQPKQSKDR